MNYTIEYINDHPEAISTIAKWHIGQWGHILPEFTLESYAGFLASHYRRGGIPSLLIALDDKKIIGTAALEDNDMDTHPELSPWIASVYTDEDYRKKGVATALFNRVVSEARLARANKLYLFTPDQEHFWVKRGCKPLFIDNYYGETESVMVLNISPQTPSR
jgi:GNAT superfamily N-acetyltransferase